jgi:hypothetical protein
LAELRPCSAQLAAWFRGSSCRRPPGIGASPRPTLGGRIVVGVAQLNLSLPEGDVAAIRARAHELGRPISTLVRDAVLGERESVLAPEQVGRLDRAEAALAGLRSDLVSLTRRVDQAAEREPWDAVEALERRLAPVFEAYERQRYG